MYVRSKNAGYCQHTDRQTGQFCKSNKQDITVSMWQLRVGGVVAVAFAISD